MSPIREDAVSAKKDSSMVPYMDIAVAPNLNLKGSLLMTQRNTLAHSTCFRYVKCLQERSVSHLKLSSLLGFAFIVYSAGLLSALNDRFSAVDRLFEPQCFYRHRMWHFRL